MSIESLAAVLPPPPMPVDSPRPEDWARIESTLGTPLPPDYRLYIETFGTGGIDGFLWVYNPFSQNRNVNLVEQVTRKLNALRELKFEKVPYRLFPEIGGLLPFAATDNANVLYWLTRGTPENWPIVIYEGRGPEHEEFKMDMTSLLTGLLTRKIASNVLPEEFPSPNYRFITP